MERIERLERANMRWRGISLITLLGLLAVAGFAYSQRDPQKGPVTDAAAPGASKPGQEPPPLTYTNFVRVSLTPEEVILDLGLNTQMKSDPAEPVFSNRVVMIYYTVKRFSNALQNVVQQYESSYGPIQLDFEKRILPGAKAPSGK
jgi:hypothetical protein